MARVVVEVMPKPEILDPQEGVTHAHAQGKLGGLIFSTGR